MLFVVAAGNSGPDDQTVATPGSASSALTVGAVDKTDNLASFSSRGPRVGDFAIKPDITAPGVDIGAARAAGTSLGSPIDDHYTRASGTSMATPHVAGAAAIVRQQRADLDAAEVKATLASTALPHDDLTVYEQGGGRVDVAGAVNTRVQATPAPVDLGFFTYPHDDTEPVSSPVTYTNVSDEPVTLDLSLQVANGDGDAAGEAMLSVEPSTLTLAPGDAATATLTLDVRHGEFGLYGGYLVTEQGGEVATRTPVGFHKESERYELSIVGIDRDGEPAEESSSVTVAAVDGGDFLEGFWLRNVESELKLRVPPGTYSITALIDTERGRRESRALVSEPEVKVTSDTRIELDARDANPITVDTPQHADAIEQSYTAITFCRGIDGDECAVNQSTFIGNNAQFDRAELYAAETDPVTMGKFSMHTGWRLMHPKLGLHVVEPLEAQLYPNRILVNSPAVDGDERLPLVHADRGRAEDYEQVDAKGAIVLARAESIFDVADMEANAAAAEAAALVVYIEGSSFAWDWAAKDQTRPSRRCRLTTGRRETCSSCSTTVR